MLPYLALVAGAFGPENHVPLALTACIKVIPVWLMAACAFSSNQTVSLGLVFSGVGDIFLEIDGRATFPLGFIGGLGFFLLAHVMYVKSFAQDVTERLNAAVAAFYYGFGLGMFLYLKPHLETALVVPVLVYAMVISSMGYAAHSRSGGPPSDTALSPASKAHGLNGALLFILSDTVLSVNKFVRPLPYGHLAIMVTYFLGQLGIMKSATSAASAPAVVANAAKKSS